MASAPQPNATELLALINDLNACNDSLLRRIAQLEEALEHSQSALQSEVERSQSVSPAPPVQAQPIAQLVAELDATTQELQRQQLVHETLRTDYDASQHRLVQLERECALLQQRYGEQSQSLIQAESSCRDLRSRLQRQQRYTLQFKVALEKCLDMSAKARPAAANHVPDNAPVAMPRAQQIKPWSTDPDIAPPDPGLDALIRGLRQDSPIGTPPPQSPAVPQPPQPEPEVENQLWQDLERVIDTSAAAHTAAPAAPSPTADPAPSIEPVAVPPAAQFTEPSPWGAPLPAAAAEPVEAAPTEPPAQTSTEPTAPPRPIQQPVAASYPLSGSISPNLSTPSEATPSPVVYPQRPPSKRKSLAAIDLPNFPRAKPRQ
jgi:hypothetical protein